MKDERTKAERLAFTLEYLVKEGHVPGLLPRDVSAAAELLRDQEAELNTLRAAMATKDHIVEAEADDERYQKRVRATFTIADPRIYYGEMMVDDQLALADHDWQLHVARQLVRVGTADWIRDLEGKALVAIHNALRDSDTLRMAETEGLGARPE